MVSGAAPAAVLALRSARPVGCLVWSNGNFGFRTDFGFEVILSTLMFWLHKFQTVFNCFSVAVPLAVGLFPSTTGFGFL